MASTVPLALLQFPGQFFDPRTGDMLAGGLLQFYEAGTTTPATVYADVNGDATLSNPVVLDSSGMAAIFLGPILYDVVVSDSLSVQLYSIEGVGNPGQIVFAGLGNVLATGSRNQTSGYQVLSTDQLVTMASTGGANPCIVNLPAASTRSTTNAGNGLPLIIKNMGTIPLAITPHGSDVIEVANAPYTLAASADPLYRAVILVSDGASIWTIIAGHGT